MFIMMNSARLSVGLEGYAMGERAFQHAAEWARSRIQGKPPVAQASGPAPIINHPDVKRMLLTMKSSTEAGRALALYAAFQLDLAKYSDDEEQRAAAQSRADLLIPIVKGWCTEVGNEMAAVGVQVHGGMGFIEETGAAQYVRDARITTIYEGTTGIQANDLLGRKIGRDRGAAMTALLGDMSRDLEAISGRRSGHGRDAEGGVGSCWVAEDGHGRAAGNDGLAAPGSGDGGGGALSEAVWLRGRWLAHGEGVRYRRETQGWRGSRIL